MSPFRYLVPTREEAANSNKKQGLVANITAFANSLGETFV